MYRLKYNDLSIYNPRLEEYIIRSPSVHLAVNEAGSMSFILESGHPHYGDLEKRKGVLELTCDDEVLYRGRIISASSDWYNSVTVRSEGMLACLNDSIVPPFSFPRDFQSDPAYEEAELTGNVVEYFLNWLLSVHNEQVGPEQQLKLGAVTVRDPNNYIFRACDDYTSAWSLVKGKLFDSALGGYLLPRYGPDGTYVDYFDVLPQTNGQRIEFGENLLDLTSEEDASDVYSAILPLGADNLTIADELDRPLTDDLTKEGLLVWSAAVRERYGYVTRVVEWSDVTETAHLLSKASAMLLAVGVSKTIEVTACDLGLSEAGISRFHVGQNTVITSVPHNLSTVYPLVEMDLDIQNPGNTVIRLSLEKAGGGLTDTMNSSVESQNDQLFTELAKYYTKNEVNDKLTDKLSIDDFTFVMLDRLARNSVSVGGTLTVGGVPIDGYAHFA